MVFDFDDPEVSERINISGKVPVSPIEKPEQRPYMSKTGKTAYCPKQG